MHIRFRLAFAIISILVFSTSIMAQGYMLRTPLKNVSDITELHVSSDQSIFALDNSNILKNILVSTNNGESYKKKSSLEAKDMHMLTNNLGFLVATNKLIKTSDKFETIEVFTLDNYFFSNVFFMNENVGFVSGENGRIHKTVDGGENWEALDTGTTNTINDVYFINSDIGFASGDNRTLLSTTNGGETWSEIVLNIEDYWPLNKIVFINDTQGLLVGSGGHIFYTNDAGLTWIESTSGTAEHINDVKYFNGQYMAVCNDGVVLQSTDLGITWSNQVIDNSDLFSLAASSSRVLIGSEAEIFQSLSDGETWSSHLIGVPLSDLDEVSFATDNLGIIVGKGNNGSAIYLDLMYRTTDAGVNWERKIVAGGYYGIHMLPNGKALTSQYNINKVGYSSDFGDTWVTINGPAITQQFITKALWLKSENDFFVGGGNYFASDGLYRYQSGSWTHEESLGNVSRIQFLNDNFGIVSNSSNQVYKTTDGGNTWQPINYNGGSFSSINFIDTTTFYIGQYVTNDGGTSFQLHNFPGYIYYFKFFTSDYALGVASTGSVYKTTDTGASWQLVDDSSIEDPNCCNNFHISEETIIALSFRSDIYTLNIGETVAIDNFEESPYSFDVYPNPTNDKIYIQNIENSLTEAILYTASGKKVATFNLEVYQDGLSIKSLSTGIYFMHLKSASKIVSIHRIIKQ